MYFFDISVLVLEQLIACSVLRSYSVFLSYNITNSSVFIIYDEKK